MSSQWRAAVLGSPIEHSLSPVLHQAAYDSLGLTEWRYERHEVGESELGRFVTGCGPEWAGLSLTMPLKHVALRLADVVDPLAEVVGAVNTLLFAPGGLLVAANTDVAGIVRAVREARATAAMEATSRLGAASAINLDEAGTGGRGAGGHSAGAHGSGTSNSVRRESGVIIGGGGTAAAAIAALGELGITTPTIAVRSLGRSGTVIRAASVMGVEPTYVTLGTEQANRAIGSADILISTIPGGASAGLVDALPDALRPDQVLLDVVYEGWPTPLPLAWGNRGGIVAPGYEMLLHQAVEQVRLMTGRMPEVEPMRAAMLAAINAT